MEIITFINPHRLSNTYLVYSPIDKKAILIDVGNLEPTIIKNEIDHRSLSLEVVLLTHEHADHCYGVDELSKILPFKLYCTKECAFAIANSKLNFSRYLADIKEFVVGKIPRIVSEEKLKISSNLIVECLPTPGHSPGSCCFIIDDVCFSGDTLMETITPLSFPNSNKKDYNKSLEKLNLLSHRINYVYPGHGKKFEMSKRTLMSK